MLPVISSPMTPVLEYGTKDTTDVEQLDKCFKTNTAPEQQNPSLSIEQGTDTTSAAPTEQPNPPELTEHAYPRAMEQPESSPGVTNPEYPRLLE